MPRHRAKGRSRHRAQRQGMWPGRARLMVARGRAPRGPSSPVSASLAAVMRLAGHPDSRRLIRGVLLTPWFAVSAGLVIAVSLTLATPHAALTFPSTRSGHCITAGCAVPGGGSSGRLPTTRRGVKLRLPKSPRKAKVGARTRAKSKVRVTASPGPVEVRYERLPEDHGRFMVMVTISGRKPLGYWSLEFDLPGGYISSIIWAKWSHAGRNGVIIHGSPPQWPRSGANQVRLDISGTGTPGRPGGCLFDGVRCTFHVLKAGDVWHHRYGRSDMVWLP